MKLLTFICISIFYSDLIQAQDNDYARIDNIIINMPRAAATSTNSIAAFIQTKCKTDKEKFRAIHRWVTYNIKYDRDSMYVFNWGANPGLKVSAAMRRRKGVCENFTAIFHEIAEKCQLQSYIVTGFTKQNGSVDRVAHTWCAVNTDGEWSFCDPTWDEAYNNNPVYFLVSPDLFIYSHMPFDPLWQLSDHPITTKEFYAGNFQPSAGKAAYNFNDSVKTFLQLNELKQFESSISRISQKQLMNDLERNNLAYIKWKAGLIYEDNDMNLYNSAVNELNKATLLYNQFVEYRNKQFIPGKTDPEIAGMLAPADASIISIQKKIDELDSSAVNAQYDTGTLKERLNKFKISLQEQKDFLKKFLSTAVDERKQLFYIQDK